MTENFKPKLIALPGRTLSRLGLDLSPEKSLHQGAVSLADQAVASATNFLTGVIIARACTKEELGLYMLGFSLISLMTDLQTSLITTPYMVYAPRLKGRAHALYTGSTPASPVGILSYCDARCYVRRFRSHQRNWSPGPGTGFVSIGCS